MKKMILIAIAFCGTLVADFRKDFIDEVLSFSSMNPTELVEAQREFVTSFYESSHQEIIGKDADLRPLFVTAQGDFERTIALMLREKKIKAALGVIHTPTPATPLCSKGEVTKELVDPSFEGDNKRIYTVMKRPEIIRDFLRSQGGIMVCYPEGGREKRTEEQLTIFEEAKNEFPNLRDIPMEIDQLEGEMIGATYLIKTLDGEDFAFSIMARQANAPEDDSTWAIWFGSKADDVVNERVLKVMGFLRPFIAPKSKL